METQELEKNLQNLGKTLAFLFDFMLSISNEIDVLSSRLQRLERMTVSNRCKLSVLEKKIK